MIYFKWKCLGLIIFGFLMLTVFKGKEQIRPVIEKSSSKLASDNYEIPKALFSSFTKKEICEVIDRIPITKIVLIESREGKYRKLLLNR